MRSRDTLVNVGLLVLRIGIGLIFIIHGVPKLMGGVEGWTQLGSTMSIVGISFAPAFWGFMAAATEVVGGLFIILGLLHRPVAVMLVFTMIVAVLMHVTAGDPFTVYSNALKALVVFVALAITGPGVYSVDYRFLRRIA
ncbi:MAG: DoxX family protein [Bacteroidales bacterium]|jgi:putative oxidoreductase|nr:DoxX family protein [Bacteroidales bacterium]